jgi:periplasmic protein CpxP/Spy
MKSIRFFRTGSLIAAIAFLLGMMPAWGQDNNAPPPPEAGHHARMMPTPEQRADHLSKKLNLTDDQKAKVLSAYQDEQKQMSDLRSDSSLSRQDRRAKMQQIHENTSTQIKGMLNPDQAKQFDEMEQNRANRHTERGQEQGAPPQ